MTGKGLFPRPLVDIWLTECASVQSLQAFAHGGVFEARAARMGGYVISGSAKSI